ncbi:hypothetical protein ACWXWK_24160, partial [Pantoea ananatis]
METAKEYGRILQKICEWILYDSHFDDKVVTKGCQVQMVREVPIEFRETKGFVDRSTSFSTTK